MGIDPGLQGRRRKENTHKSRWGKKELQNSPRHTKEKKQTKKKKTMKTRPVHRKILISLSVHGTRPTDEKLR